MPYFLSPKVIYGKGAFKRLSAELEGKGSRAAIITDRILKEKCADLVEGLKAAGYEVTLWDGVEADPTLQQVGFSSNPIPSGWSGSAEAQP
jgi:alcohol dehydrogenase class IV